jgi:hypothetical protein
VDHHLTLAGASVKKRTGGTGAKGQTDKVGFCGANKRTGGTCKLAAGFRTSHYGIGKCIHHGGGTISHVKSAATQELRLLLGNPIEINPIDAILRCISIRNGEITWLSEKMGELQEAAWLEDTIMGKQFHVFARERSAAMADLVRYSQIAVNLGIAERAIKLAETYGELLADYTRGLLDDLWEHLDQAGRDKAPQIVRRRLIAIDGGMHPDADGNHPAPALELAAGD